MYIFLKIDRNRLVEKQQFFMQCRMEGMERRECSNKKGDAQNTNCRRAVSSRNPCFASSQFCLTFPEAMSTGKEGVIGQVAGGAEEAGNGRNGAGGAARRRGEMRAGRAEEQLDLLMVGRIRMIDRLILNLKWAQKSHY